VEAEGALFKRMTLNFFPSIVAILAVEKVLCLHFKKVSWSPERGVAESVRQKRNFSIFNPLKEEILKHKRIK